MTDRLPDDVALALACAADRLGSFAGRVKFLPVVSSTNDVALDLAANGADDGTTVMAATQTAGRGRQGRAWFSPIGGGLYFSSVLRGLQPELVTLMAGVALGGGGARRRPSSGGAQVAERRRAGDGGTTR